VRRLLLTPLLVLAVSGCAADPAATLRGNVEDVIGAANGRDAVGVRSAVGDLIATINEQRAQGDLSTARAAELRELALAVQQGAGALTPSPSPSPVPSPSPSPSPSPRPSPSPSPSPSPEPTEEPSPSPTPEEVPQESPQSVPDPTLPSPAAASATRPSPAAPHAGEQPAPAASPA